MSQAERDAAEGPGRSTLPWPALALAAVGAWLCTALLAFAMIVLFAGVNSALPRIAMGAAFVVAALLSLRMRSGGAFVEQLFLPLFAVGLGTLAWAAEVGDQLRMLLVGAGCLAVAVYTQRAMLQTLLGAVGIAGCVGALAQGFGLHEGRVLTWLVALLAAGCWWAAQRAQLPRWRNTWARIGSGAALLALGFAAWQSGWAMGASRAVGVGGGFGLGGWGTGFGAPGHLLSAAAGLVAIRAAWAASRHLQGLAASVPWVSRACSFGALACVCLLQPWFGLCVGMALLAGAWGQRAISGVAAFAALWTVLAIYGLQQPSFNVKALMLAAAGGLLIAGAWQMRPPKALANTASLSQARRRPWALLASVAAVCLVVGVGTVQKERLRTNGETVLIPLAPVDPRSIMQGDYMTLGFDLGVALVPDAQERRAVQWVARLGARDGVGGVLQQLRHQAKDTPLVKDERRLKVRWVQNRVSMPTDAFFFAEGTGQRYEAARFGIFKLGANGDTLLIGLADAKGQRIN